LREDAGDVHVAMLGCEGSKPPRGLLELALAAHAVAAPGLVPGDRDVDEALEEVLLGRLGGPPRELQFLVRGEELACPNQLEPGVKRRL
jgi:hypothetical protein